MWRLRMPQAYRESAMVRRDYASAFSARAVALNSLGEGREALLSMSKSIEIFEALVKADADNLGAQMDLIACTSNRALLLYDLGDKEAYKQDYEQVLILAQRLYAARPLPRAEEFRLKALYNLSYAYSELKDPRADAMLAATTEAMKRRADANPKDMLSRVQFADLLLNLRHRGFDNPREALPYAEQITVFAPRELNGWELVAEAQLQLKNYDGAVAALEKGLTCVPTPKAGEQPSKLYAGLVERIERYREQAATAAKQKLEDLQK